MVIRIDSEGNMDSGILASDSDTEHEEYILEGMPVTATDCGEAIVQSNANTGSVQKKEKVIAALACLGAAYGGLFHDVNFSIWKKYSYPPDRSSSADNILRECFQHSYRTPNVVKRRIRQRFNIAKKCINRAPTGGSSFISKEGKYSPSSISRNCNSNAIKKDPVSSVQLLPGEFTSQNAEKEDCYAAANYFLPCSIFDDDIPDEIRFDHGVNPFAHLRNSESLMNKGGPALSSQSAVGKVLEKHIELTERRYLDWERNYYPRLF